MVRRRTIVQAGQCTYRPKLYAFTLILFLMAVSCQSMQGSGIRDTAIRKQNAAMYYYEQRDYEKAKELCEEAIELWNKLKEVPIKSTPDWAIDSDIARCKHILRQKPDLIIRRRIREEDIELQKKPAEKKRLASLPKEVAKPLISTGKLRDTPKDLGDYEVKRMIEKYNFFEKDLNESGDFPNDLVDNGDGTITDRATGLMWEKGGSPSLLRYRDAQKYVPRLNRENFSGCTNWRIPTVAELASLLERTVNERGLHINSLFSHKQSLCWSSDPRPGDWRVTYGALNHTVDFRKGGVDGAYVMAVYSSFATNRCFIRAVRTIK